jgi:transcription initiation protein SPT3
MFVFGEIQDPNPETVNLVEDIVRSQLIELVSFLYFNDEIHL